MRASAPPREKPFRRSKRFQARHLRLDTTQNRTETTHGAVQAHAVPGTRTRDEPSVAIHLVALRVRAAGLPERGYLRQRQRFVAKHRDMFIDLKPRYLVLLKEDVTRLLLLRSVENTVDVLLHDSGNFYHGRSRWQTLLTRGAISALLLQRWSFIRQPFRAANHQLMN